MASYRWRSATPGDVPAIRDLVARCDPDGPDAERIAADLRRPGLELALDTRVVEDEDGVIVARAWVNRRSEADVHPAHRGRGLGGELLGWIVDRAVQAGEEQVVQTVRDDDVAAGALLAAHGFEAMVTSWMLEKVLADEPGAGVTAGITVRPYRESDARAAYEMVEDAFQGLQGRRLEFGEWQRQTVGRGDFAPEFSPVACDGERIVGAVLTLKDGYVERVAVDREYRSRGIARQLLRQAFRDLHEQKVRSCTLWTHSALGLYQRAGMVVRRSATVYRKGLVTPRRSG
ncbi:GNAT family N-acetyltransferase [Winogradskya consettensis]|uniref:GNAT family N-acetyltransferase n=1 Tax=Winogradskya consettensis TaxID=113560 RepID=UPI001BB36911